MATDLGSPSTLTAGFPPGGGLNGMESRPDLQLPGRHARTRQTESPGVSTPRGLRREGGVTRQPSTRTAIADDLGRARRARQGSEGSARKRRATVHTSTAAELTIQSWSARKRPDKAFINPDGSIRGQCVDLDGDGVFDVRYRIEAGAVSEGWVDTDRDGVGEQRQVYAGGQPARIEVDTNDDGRADVVQYLSNGNVARQCEDAEFDGRIDRCFEGETLVGVSGVTDVGAHLESLGCGSLHPFWRER
jgi:hypothetical protein